MKRLFKSNIGCDWVWTGTVGEWRHKDGKIEPSSFTLADAERYVDRGTWTEITPEPKTSRYEQLWQHWLQAFQETHHEKASLLSIGLEIANAERYANETS